MIIDWSGARHYFSTVRDWTLFGISSEAPPSGGGAAEQFLTKRERLILKIPTVRR